MTGPCVDLGGSVQNLWKECFPFLFYMPFLHQYVKYVCLTLSDNLLLPLLVSFSKHTVQMFHFACLTGITMKNLQEDAPAGLMKQQHMESGWKMYLRD